MAATSALRRVAPAVAPVAPARIGPNALIQTREVVRLLYGPATWDTLRVAARLPRDLPGEMVNEALFQRLVHEIVREFGTVTTNRILLRSGERTADYVRRNRIPSLARGALRVLPRRPATRLLLRSIQRHGWTFLGSGRMEHDLHHIVIHDCVTCRDVASEHPMGGFYVGAFQGLIETLADPRIRVTETRCMARGDPDCRFELHSSSPTPPLSGASNPPG